MGLFNRKPKPVCPVTPDDKQFIEANYNWFFDQFGAIHQHKIIIPSRLKIKTGMPPRQLAGALTKFVCGRMSIDPGDVELHFYDNSQLNPNSNVHINFDGGKSLGEYHHRNHITGKFDIHLNIETLGNVEEAVSTIAHELAHVKLLGEFRMSGAEESHEMVTDLTAIYFGFGVFMMNSAFYDKTVPTSGGWMWSMGKRGYLPLEMIAHALAVHTFLLNDKNPEWLGDMDKANRKMVERAIAYLVETGDCMV